MKNLGEGNRQPGQERRLEPVPDPELHDRGIASAGQSEDPDRILFGIDDPVSGDASYDE